MIENISNNGHISSADNNDKEKQFWLNTFSNDLLNSFFPYDLNWEDSMSKDRGREGSSPIDSQPFEIDGQLFLRLMQESSQSPHKIHIILTTILILLLDKITGNSDIIVATPIYKPDVMAKFINTVLPLRVLVDSTMSFRNLLRSVSQTLILASDRQNYPIDALLKQLNRPPSDEQPSLLDTAIAVENIHDPSFLHPVHPKMTFLFRISNNSIQGTVEFHSNLYKPSTIQRIVLFFKNLSSNALPCLDIPLSKLEIVSEAEKNDILSRFNHITGKSPTQPTHHRPKTVIESFLDQVEKFPFNIAVAADKSYSPTITYSQLDRESGSLAFLFKEQGITGGSVVAFFLEDPTAIIITILAVVKCGGIYIPIDTHCTPDQVTFILEHNNPYCCITHKHNPLPYSKLLKVLIFENLPGIIPPTPHCLQPLCPPDNHPHPFCILSIPSTPGNMQFMTVHNHDIDNVFPGAFETLYPRFTGDGPLNIALLASFMNPVSIIQLYGALLHGFTLYPAHIEDTQEGGKLYSFFRNHHIHISDGTTQHMEMLTEYYSNTPGASRFSPPHLVVMSERPLSKKIVNQYRSRMKEKTPPITYLYSTPQSNIFSTLYRPSIENLESLDREYLPLGKPYPPYHLYVVDGHNTLLPPGVAGELCIAGPAINPGLPEDPFFPGNTPVKTGNLTYWQPDGSLVFSGYTDRRIIRNWTRIEPEKVEEQLLKHIDVKEAVVIPGTKQEPGNRLTAYFVSNKNLDSSELHSMLTGKIPAYMVPQTFIQVERIPLTMDMKPDIPALQNLGCSTPASSAKKLHAIEKKLSEIWMELLELEPDSFNINSEFVQIGGQSLQAIMLSSRIHEEFNISLPIPKIFELSTIQKLSVYIDNAVETAFTPLEIVEEKEYYLLSPAQKRLYFLHRMNPTGTGYNVTQVVSLEGHLHCEKLEQSFSQLILRHESFRTSFEIAHDYPVQRILPNADFKITFFNLPEPNSKEEELKIIRQFIQPFDLTRPPLLGVAILKRNETNHILILDRHHIISDATSRGILLKELVELYEGNPLPPIKIQYHDYSEWLNSPPQQQALKQEEEYWLKKFEGIVPTHRLPTDYPPSDTLHVKGNIFNFYLDKNETRSIRQIADEEDATLYMILLAVFTVFLSKITGRQDISVGTPLVGRRHVDLEHIIGIFVNTIVMRNFPSPDITFNQFLADVKNNALQAFENQMYPFEDLVEKLDIKRTLNSNPLFDTVFLLQPKEKADIKRTQLKILPYEHDVHTSNFDLTLQAVEGFDNIFFTFDYKSALFKKETIEKLAGHFKEIVRSIIENKEITLNNIVLSSSVETIQSSVIHLDNGDFGF